MQHARQMMTCNQCMPASALKGGLMVCLMSHSHAVLGFAQSMNRGVMRALLVCSSIPDALTCTLGDLGKS